VGRLLVEGGGTLVQAFLAQGLADEFHRFQTDRPVGGPPLDLAFPESWSRAAAARWPGGVWEVWR